MRTILSNLYTLALNVGVCAVVVLTVGKSMFERPGPLNEPVTVHIEPGASLTRIAQLLEDTRVIDNRFVFKAAATVLGVAGDVKAGDYAIAAAAPMADVLDTMTEGRAIQHRITVAEGLTVRQTLALIEGMEVLTGDIDEIPAEGMLAPDTYFVRRGETRQAVVNRMLEAQERQLAELWAARTEGLPLASPEEAMILASIIEKETAVPTERRLVASVFINRLNKGMRLQTDPTVIYGITLGEGPLGRPISRTDLRTPTPYNTYTIDGLPPTPIANPGRASIAAALNPDISEYLYFVADGTGGHAFAKTLREHNRNVAEWRKIERARRSDG